MTTTRHRSSNWARMGTTFVIGALSAAIFTAMIATSSKADAPKQSVYSFTVKNIDGKDIKLKKYKGDVLLIVNTASLCGNTPQYAALESLYEQYKGQGFRILGFPANDFAQQEPGSNGQIKEFCTSKYKVSFDMFSKISVKQPDQAPLYTYLTDKTSDPQFGGDIEWNFAKFLIGRDGTILNRFPAGHSPASDDVVTAIKAALAQSNG
jgi:glutathione peroxidase